MYFLPNVYSRAFFLFQTFTKVDDRWSYRADTVKQFAMCIKERLARDNMTSVALYFDVWRSLNNRFQQRCIY